ncbi:hypothetical protein PHJA_002887600 [Phtheirospermum japonicum]|uniref:S-protein homolog n=1 Tax=Phtheirospermum japonicum TaxID=374723 RepID=A0A830DGK8_9LAMI|nr:hypothetical protein PHJA_002887600 [Phtheirospermum japonicum]
MKFTVHIVNNLPPNSPPLSLHCASKNDDLGHHNLTTNQDFHFSFCDNPFSTLFFCRFQWNNKNTSFDVYSAGWKYNRCEYGVCGYGVKSDGIYFSLYYPLKNLTKYRGW